MILLDNTVLSNFALIEQTDLLAQLLGDTAATTSEVMSEFEAGVTLGRVPPTDLNWLSIIKLTPSESTTFKQILLHLNAGEASCLAVALGRDARVLTDDRDARKLAIQMQIPVSGTLGILVQLVRSKRLTLTAANDLLKQMIDKGYRAPLDKLDSLLEE